MQQAAGCLMSALPITKWLPHYRWQHLRYDVLAGVTVGLMVIPQGLAYAQVAKLPVQYGLYSAFMGPFVYCLLGTSKDVTLGPTAIMSLMTALFNAAPGPSPKDATYAVLLCFFCGVAQLLLGVLRMGLVVSFISRPVVSAFTTSAAITIAWGQVKSLLGLKGISDSLPVSVYQIARDIGRTNFWDLSLGCCCIVALLLLMKLDTDVRSRTRGEPGQPAVHVRASRHLLRTVCISRNALVVLAAALVAYSLQQVHRQRLTLTPRINGSLPQLKLPSFQLLNGTGSVVRSFSQIVSDIGVGFAVVPFIGLVETIAISKAFARQNNYRIDASQELIAIGAANLLGSFVSSYPVTGSFTRTAINNQSGVRTPAGGVFTGAVVILALVVFSDAFQFIPKASLAAVIIVAVLRMTDFRLLPRLLTVRKTDAAEWVATFVVSLAFGVEYGIIAGICVSFVFLLLHFTWPGMKFEVGHSGLPVLSLRSGVRFPAADRLEEEASAAAEQSGCEMFCVDLGHAAWLDFAVVDALLLLQTRLRVAGRRLLLVAADADVHSRLQAAGLEVFHSMSQLEQQCNSHRGADENSPLLQST